MTLDFSFIHKNGDSKGAILLFHGLTGSPFELKKYGLFLFNNGYDVFAQCLPGHGEKFSEIYTVKYTDWLDFAYEKFIRLKQTYDDVFVSGLCLGAVLSLAVAEKYPVLVSGVISLSATLYLDGWRLPWYKFLIPVALSTIIRYYYNYPECEPYGIKNEKTRSMVKKLLEKGDVGMNDFPMSGIYELLKLSSFVIKNLETVISPVLIIHSQQDDLTGIKSAKTVYKKIKSSDKKLIILNNSYHMVLYDNEKEYVFACVLNFADSHIQNGIKLKSEI